MTSQDTLQDMADKFEACQICKGEGRVKVGWHPVSNVKIKVEYDPCPGCQPGPHGFHARQAADHIRALIAQSTQQQGDTQ